MLACQGLISVEPLALGVQATLGLDAPETIWLRGPGAVAQRVGVATRYIEALVIDICDRLVGGKHGAHLRPLVGGGVPLRRGLATLLHHGGFLLAEGVVRSRDAPALVLDAALGLHPPIAVRLRAPDAMALCVGVALWPLGAPHHSRPQVQRVQGARAFAACALVLDGERRGGVVSAHCCCPRCQGKGRNRLRRRHCRDTTRKLTDSSLDWV
mmetsp:Transcript_122827/g.342633  ORF Transcript_122827/g.342633 Transcript_122827/m.342633 type:complete len:212 (+) Transcript_122827:264-899(+)